MAVKLSRLYVGSRIIIYYIGIDSFVDDLREIGEILDNLAGEGCILSIIPNIGLTKTSLLLGTSFQGVKGLAVIVEKR